ncbi:hypothetical protein HR45_15890 [Shewanella mangrovi]|uniref:Uncharacterized protein n=1 Tax=Shewanella mangrovi TaxID=1515746 RepID=A0A094LMW7_9GAMM|nr:hypothetical protein [Shewanella mangrovi]KFZ36463.1 hypothetical protein HR45_15890 [Shewanella mangrovi]
MIIGNPAAKRCVYLPHSPNIPDGWQYKQQNAMEHLLEVNSNHWRKIFVISAKIFCDDADEWRSYLRQNLLHSVCFYTDEQQLNTTADVILLSGKEIAQRLLPDTNPSVLNDKILRLGEHCWQLPYFDYRQFPNQLIADFRQCLI